jgi:hypothetical protein
MSATPPLSEMSTQQLLAELASRFDQSPSPMSKIPSPTPSTTPTPSSDVVASMMREMTTMFRDSLREIREMVVDMTQGRRMQATGQQEIASILPASDPSYDFDSTPLAPGIEAILQREDEESLQRVLLRERAELMGRLAELDNKRRDLEMTDDSDNGPWTKNSDEAVQS